MRLKVAFLVLMLAVTLSSIPVLRSTLKHTSNFLKTSYDKNIQLLKRYESKNAAAAAAAAAAASVSISKNYISSETNSNINMASPATDGPLPSTTPVPATEPEVQPELPKLSAADFRTYNKLAEMMEYYHNHFRHTWTTLHNACKNNKRPSGMSIPQFLNLATQFISQLTLHHNIEETHIFPVLAKNMPEFRAHSTMVTQHKAIHDGLDRLEKYVGEVRRGERELRLSGEGSLREVMDSFGGVLWAHLDEEVRNLGAENMRRYWTKGDMARFNF